MGDRSKQSAKLSALKRTSRDACHSQYSLHCPASTRSDQASHIHLVDGQELGYHNASRSLGFGRIRLTKDEGMGVGEDEESPRLGSKVECGCHGGRLLRKGSVWANYAGEEV